MNRKLYEDFVQNYTRTSYKTIRGLRTKLYEDFVQNYTRTSYKTIRGLRISRTSRIVI